MAALNAAQSELVARWATPDGLPFKGRLIAKKKGVTCLCAQGQTLHYIGGWSLTRLRKTDKTVADRATASLLGISLTHAVLLRMVNDELPGAPSAVLTDPERVLGINAAAVLAFWRHLDRMNADDWDAVRRATSNSPRYEQMRAANAVAAAASANVAGQAVRHANLELVWHAVAVASSITRFAVWDGTACSTTSSASNEIQVADIMVKRRRPLFSLRAFGFSTVASVLAAAAA